MSQGVVYVAYGTNARNEAAQSIKSLRKHNQLPVAVISDEPIDGTQHLYMKDTDKGGRWAKLSLDLFSPFEQTLYIDADTRVQSDITKPFEILGDGWDMVVTPSSRQGSDTLGHLPLVDRELTLDTLGLHDVLNLQAGVMYLRKSEALHRLFTAWREEWQRFKLLDQGALLRALAREPIRIWILGRTYNGGKADLVWHQFGKARR